MTSDFRAFAIAPKTIVPQGQTITVAQIRTMRDKFGDKKTPYLYACFGDVALTSGMTISNGFIVGGGVVDPSGCTLKAGCILGLSNNSPVDLAASANPAMIIWFAT